MTVGTTHHTVNMVDVDAIQVNFARFFVWMDDGYNSLLRQLGHPLSGILAEGFATPAVDAWCNYRRAVSLDDAFALRTAITRIGRSSFDVSYRFEQDEDAFALGRVTHVWVEAQAVQLPGAVPAWLYETIEPDFMGMIPS